jgi:streptogramin lyase
MAETRIDKIYPATGEVVASIPARGGGSDSGLAWAEGSLWVGQYRDRKIHQIDPKTGAVLERLEMPPGTGVSGLESDGANLFYCGGGSSGTVRAVRRPK